MPTRNDSSGWWRQGRGDSGAGIRASGGTRIVFVVTSIDLDDVRVDAGLVQREVPERRACVGRVGVV